MARPAKKPPEQWENEILDAAQNLFLSKGYEETSVSDIMQAAGGATGMFYRCYQRWQMYRYYDGTYSIGGFDDGDT